MTDITMSHVVRHDTDTCTGGGNAAPRVARWLGLAAAPTFALMALWNWASGGAPDMMCMQHTLPLSGMGTMYLLMSAFHAAPWLRLTAGR